MEIVIKEEPCVVCIYRKRKMLSMGKYLGGEVAVYIVQDERLLG